MSETFRTGFIGSSTDEAALWMASLTEGAKSICVPFTGSCKSIAAMSKVASPGVEVDSWDVQVLVDAIMNGVFAQAEAVITTPEPRFKKGRMYESRAVKDIDSRSAGFFDYIIAHGSKFEIAALSSAIIRSTFMGRGTEFDGTFESFLRKYRAQMERNMEWLNLNEGKFNHQLGDFYQNIPDKHYDVLQVDPPKITSTRDVYSKGPFERLNYCMHGPEIPKWTRRDIIPRLRRAFAIDSDLIIFMYVTGVRPTPEEVVRILPDYGTLEEIKEFHHRNRSDYGYVIRRK